MGKLFLLIVAMCSIKYTEAETPEVIDCVSTLSNTWELQSHPSDCNAYVPCMNDVGVVFRCPDGLHFDADRIICDVPENAGCAPPTESPPPPEVPANPCNSLSEYGGEVPHSTYCERFINCVDQNEGLVSFCPAGLYFNALMQVCDIPTRAQCLLEVCKDQPDGLLASKNSCRHYIQCQSSKANLHSCVDGAVFDESQKMCVPEDVSNQCQPQEIPLPPAEVEELCIPFVASQMIGHPDYCDVYYRCINGVLTGRRCQSGLFFNQRVCFLMGDHECVVWRDDTGN